MWQLTRETQVITNRTGNIRTALLNRTHYLHLYKRLLIYPLSATLDRIAHGPLFERHCAGSDTADRCAVRQKGQELICAEEISPVRRRAQVD